MTNSYLSWAKSAEKLAKENPVKYELIEDDDVKVGMITLNDGKMNAFGFDLIDRQPCFASTVLLVRSLRPASRKLVRAGKRYLGREEWGAGP